MKFFTWLTLFTVFASASYADPVQPVSGVCVGDACDVAELHIANDGCVRIENRSNRLVQLTFTAPKNPADLIRVSRQADASCVGDFLGEYQLRFYDVVG